MSAAKRPEPQQRRLGGTPRAHPFGLTQITPGWRKIARMAVVGAVCLSAGCTKETTAPLPSAAVLAGLVATCAEARRVEVKRWGEASWQPATVGAAFREGDWVRTGAQGHARIAFAAGGSLRLGSESMVIIRLGPRDGGGASPVVAMVAGAATGTSGPDEHSFLIQGPDSAQFQLVGAPGSPLDFRLTAHDAGVEVAVSSGAATLEGATGQAQLALGQAVDLGGKGLLSDVVQLPIAPLSLSPGIDTRVRWTSGMAITLAWKPVPNAAQYRVQVGRDLAMSDVVESMDTVAATYFVHPPSLGVYTWRVASQDVAGRVGEYGFTRRIFCEGEEPTDLLLSPAPDAVVLFSDAAPPIVFSWTGADRATSYRLVVSRSAELSSAVTWKAAPSQTITVPGLTAGVYYWGVYVEGGGEKANKPIFVAPRKLTLKKVSKALLDAPKQIGNWGVPTE